MRLLALAFPRLPVQLARLGAPELAGRPFVVISGEGESALVAAASPEASAAGIDRGMLIATALGHCPAVATVAPNAGDCLDALEQAASILRNRATPNVAIAGRDHILVDLHGLEPRFADEEAAAVALSMLARSWTRLDVRAGVAGTREPAIAAARTARRLPVIEPLESSDPERLVVTRDPEITASFEFAAPASAVECRARIARSLARLETLLAGRDESFRALTLTVTGSAGDAATLQLSSHEPLHSAAEAIELLAPHLATSLLDGVVRLELALRRLGPSMRVEPLRREQLPSRLVAVALDPRQPLLRAS